MDKTDIQDVLEDGEIETSDSEDGYIPLKRPENYSEVPTKSQSQQIQQDSEHSDHDSENNSSDDSDSAPAKQKKPRAKLKPVKRLTKKNKKYEIWNERIQEDVLTESLQQCDVTKKDRSRDVESYDYVFSARYHEIVNCSSDRKNRKRNRDDRNNSELIPSSNDEIHGSNTGMPSRNILNLTTNLEDSLEDIAKDISNKLCEEKEGLIVKVLSTIGKERSIEFFRKTQEVEAQGGLMILNCKRRRTPGGVFLYLIRMDDNVTREEKNKMFDEERDGVRKKMKEKRKQKLNKLKKQTAEERLKIFPELLIDKERFGIDGNSSKRREDVLNPPPSPEPNQSDLNIGDEKTKLTTYDEDFLDLNCSHADMELF